MPRIDSKLAQHHDEFVEKIKKGWTHRQLADHFGVAQSVVSNYNKNHVWATVRRPTGTVTPTGAVSQEEILRTELRELRASLTKDRKADVAEERILAGIDRALAKVRVPQNRIVATPTGLAAKEAHHRQFVILSDFHGGEVVDSTAVHGLNSYSWEVMEARVDETIAALLSHKKNSPALTGLTIFFGGDMCSGDNHEELAETNQYPLAEQGVKMGYLQAKIVEALAPHYPQIDVLVVPGNHPRLKKKPAAKQVHSNMDWVAGKIMEQYLVGFEHVNVTIARGPSLLYEIAGRTMYLWHGDGVMSTMPGVPWGGVMRRTAAIQEQHGDRRIHHFVLGHYHQPNVVQGGRIIMNGALKGCDEWSLKSFGGGAAPTQLLCTFDEKRQRMTDVKFITPTAGCSGA